MVQTFEREMTISHSDFFRILPKAIEPHRYQCQNNIITVVLNEEENGDESQNKSSNEAEIIIILSDEGLRKIASLSLPVTKISFQIKNVAEKAKTDFFKHFDRAYHRGGG